MTEHVSGSLSRTSFDVRTASDGEAVSSTTSTAAGSAARSLARKR
ncbi:hypothetical protein ACFV3R_32220 [Streptomyces sp. NPDC059740]